MATVNGHADVRRFTADNPCPVCNGSDDDARGAGKRCHGFVSSDGEWVHCTRVGDGCKYHDRSETYSHRAKGPCKCGREHAPADVPSGAAAAGRRRGKIVAFYSYDDPDGKLAHQVIRREDPKSFSQRRPDPTKPNGWAYSVKGIATYPYRLPELLAADPADWVVVVEGEKDANRGAKLGLVTTTNAMGAGKWMPSYSAFLKGRRVAVVPDNDQAGKDHAQAVAKSLVGLATEIRIVELPDVPEKGDLSDYLDLGHSVADFRKLVEETPNWTATADGKPPGEPGNEQSVRQQPDDGKPVIVIDSKNIDDRLGKWTGQSLEALKSANSPPTLFQRGGLLSRLRFDPDGGPPSIEVATLDAMRGHLDRVAHWGETRIAKNGDPFVKWGPPRMEIVRDLMSLPGWDQETIPPLETIIESPRFLPSGQLITTPGYHPEARSFYKAPAGWEEFRVPDRPSDSEVTRAVSLIFGDLFVDFPFDGRASRANALACMLLPFVRLMIPGPTPLHMFEASTEGTGKGKLASMCAFPSIGMGLHSTVQKENDAEWRKAITSALMTGSSHIFIDNMFMPVRWCKEGDYPVPVDSGVLASALSQDRWTDRVLGVSDDAHIKIRCVWMATGNNVEWSRELARRVIPIRLNAPLERPWERTGFMHDPIEQWAQEHRLELVQACLTLCQNWITRGRPEGNQVLGTYESYARTMGGILDAAGVKGFLGNASRAAERDQSAVCWTMLVEAWNKRRGQNVTSAADAYEIIADSSQLTEAFSDLLGDDDSDATKVVNSKKKRLGKALARQEGRIWGGYRICRLTIKTANKNLAYRLVPATESPDSEDEETEESESEREVFVPF